MVFPHLSEFARAYKDKGLKVVSICVEQDSPALQQFVDQQGSKMDYTVRPVICVHAQCMQSLASLILSFTSAQISHCCSQLHGVARPMPCGMGGLVTAICN